MELGWNFDTNDMAIENGDFMVLDDASLQNATLILLKQATNIYDGKWGVNLESLYPNVSQEYIDGLTAEAQSQVLNDGAQQVSMSVVKNLENIEIDINCKY